MALQIQPAAQNMPMPMPIIQTRIPKSAGFTFLPAGTKRVYDGGHWGLYYYAPARVSFLVYDVGDEWRVKPVLGKVKLSYAKSVMSTKPCCQGD